MGNLWVKDDQPRLVTVGDVGIAFGADVDASELATGAALTLEAADDLRPHVFLVQTLRLILRGTGDVGLQVIPVLSRPRVKVRRSITELGQRGMEVARHIPRYRGAKEHALSTNALVGRTRRDGRRSTEEHGAREPLGEGTLPEQRLLFVDASWLRVRPVDIGVDDRLPGVLKILCQFGIHIRRGERNRSGHDQWRCILTRPEGVNDRAHQAQHTTCALEAFKGRPLLVESVEHFRVDRVGPLDAVFIRGVACFAREVVGVFAVHLDVGSRSRTDGRERGGVCVFEQPLLDDVVRLVGRRRPPLICHATYDVLESFQRLQSVGAADLFGVSSDDLVPAVAAFRGGDRNR